MRLLTVTEEEGRAFLAAEDGNDEIIYADEDGWTKLRVFKERGAGSYLVSCCGESELPEGVVLAERLAAAEARCGEALDVLTRYGQTDGAHHKTWVIDQAVRALTGDGYDEHIRRAKDGEDGPDTYGWDEGIAP